MSVGTPVVPSALGVIVSDTATLRRLAISPTGFVFDPVTGATYSVNETGRAILEGLRDGADLDALSETLAKTFTTDAVDLRRDIMEFVRLLCEQGLLPPAYEVV